MKKPFILVISGPIGSGKTTVANTLKRHLPNSAFISTDDIRYFLNSYQRKPIFNAITRNVISAMTASYTAQKINVVIASSWPKKMFLTLRKGSPKASLYSFVLQIPEEEATRRVRGGGRNIPSKKMHTNHLFYSKEYLQESVLIDTYQKNIYTVKKEILTALKKDLGLVTSI